MAANLQSRHTSIALLQAAQGGDQSAANELMERYFERVLRIVRARMGTKLRARQDSMDIAQNAMLRVIQALDDFEAQSEGSLIHWMSRLVENEIRDQADFMQAQKRRLSKEIAVIPSTEGRPGLESFLHDPEQKTVSQNVAHREELSRLEKALDQLGNHKEPILMHDYAGMTFKEIGKELGLKEDAARMRYVRAMDKLTDIMVQTSHS